MLDPTATLQGLGSRAGARDAVFVALRVDNQCRVSTVDVHLCSQMRLRQAQAVQDAGVLPERVRVGAEVVGFVQLTYKKHTARVTRLCQCGRQITAALTVDLFSELQQVDRRLLGDAQVTVAGANLADRYTAGHGFRLRDARARFA